MARNFCVMTVEEKYDAATEKMKTRYINHRVIVGSEEAVNTFKTRFEEDVKG